LLRTSRALLTGHSRDLSSPRKPRRDGGTEPGSLAEPVEPALGSGYEGIVLSVALKHFISGERPEFMNCSNYSQSPSVRAEHLWMCYGVGTNSSPRDLQSGSTSR